MTTENVIAFLVYPHITALDLIGPLEVFKALESRGGARVVTVGERKEPMDTESGLRFEPERTFDEVPNPYGLIVPGGLLGPFGAMANDRLMAYVRAAGEGASIVGSVCTGSLILAAAGLLEGRRATTHWACMSFLERLGARPVSERWVEDGKFITAAGVSSGIDMALALAARLSGEPAARAAQLILEYSPEPPFGDIDRSKVDADGIQAQMGAVFVHEVPKLLAKKPELLARLLPG